MSADELPDELTCVARRLEEEGSYADPPGAVLLAVAIRLGNTGGRPLTSWPVSMIVHFGALPNEAHPEDREELLDRLDRCPAKSRLNRLRFGLAPSKDVSFRSCAEHAQRCLG